ncbi:hypothetical protein C0J52_15543 [Blattella germanica]|nr:hypothetical protein C0J52_15543 [Blattella germanica]
MRTYKKVLSPTRKSNYNPEYLINAVKSVQSGKLSIRKASEQSEETSWAASFEQKLKQARCDKTSATSLRAKRLSLTPGKGIVARDFDKNEIGNENSISSDRNEEELDTCEDEEMKLKGNKNAGDELNVNDFAVVKFPTKKRIRFFIGRIDSVEYETYDMTFLMKKIVDDSIYFVYPDNEDAVEVEKNTDYS